jgi:Family of unknown function (DUF5995)
MRTGRTASTLGVIAAGLAALLLAAPAAKAITQDGVPPTSTSLLPALLDSPNLTAFDPTSPDACTAGKMQCLDEVIRDMTKRSRPLIDACDHNAAFSLLYLRVTESIKQHIIDNPILFRHADFIIHQDMLFAKMYWRAYDLWSTGQRSGLPKAWLTTFDAGRDRSLPATGDLYLGINAHVLADLPVLIYQLGLTDENGQSRKPDHDAVNLILYDVYPSAIAEISARLDPTLGESGALSWTTLDDDTLFQSLIAWREQAWRYAEDLAAAPDDVTRQAVFNNIQSLAAAQALTYRNALAYPPLEAAQDRADRYNYCMTHH